MAQLAAQLPNIPAQDLTPFLHLLGEQPNSDYQIAQMLQQSPQAHETSNPLPHWTHYLQSTRLDAPLFTLFPDHFQDLCPLLHTLLQQGCQYKTLLNALNDLQATHSQHNPAHLAQQFRQVLHLLMEYHAPDPLCQQAFATCQQHTPEQWPPIIHQQLVAHTFLPAHERTLDELINYIATHAPHTPFANNPAQLKQSYQEVYTAYHAPSPWLLAHVQQQEEKQAALTKPTVPIAQWPAQTVSQWAQRVKAHVADPTQGTIPSQAERIAVVMRAVALHHGFLPRDTQVLSLLTLLNTASNAGRLAQINTGEGKSLIVAMLAALHALQGTKVDVITTSPELSIPEINKQALFFSMLTLTVGENSSLGQWKEDEARKQLYQQDIVYGTAGDFQADILRTEFCGNNLRGNRGFGVVIVDEVDSMLFDDRTHSTRLATPLPAMNHLELPLAHIYNYVNMVARRLITIHEKEGDQTLPKHYYIADDFQRNGHQIILKHHPDKPWQELAVPVQDKAKFLQDNATEHLQTLLRPLHGQEREAHEEYQKLNEKIIALSHKIAEEEEKQKAQQGELAEEELHNMPEWQEREKLHDQLNNCHWEKAYTPVLDVPAHLRHFAHQQVPHWVQSAMSALFLQQKDRNYAVRRGKIVPIDYNNTGVLQQNMVWSDGLAQFLQIKEGLKVSPEGISTNYLSTISFFKRYGAAVYGLTGTMGNETTQNFFQTIYGTDAIIIPPYKHRPIVGNQHSHYHCKELTAQILPTQEQWQQTICQSVIAKAQQKQAILVICKYIQQAKTLQAQITQHYNPNKVYTYTGTDTFKKEQVDAGDIILATNIAGRGTDLTTTAEVEAHGGLHVCITFLPESYRVELQNAGRTARKGQKGTAQLIIHDPAQPTIEALRTLRQEREDEAIAQAQKGVDQILLKDQLFGRYCALDNALLPNQEESQKQAQYQLLTHEWALCRQQALTPTRLQALYRQAIDTATTTQLATKVSNTTHPAEAQKVEKIIRATVLPQKITHQDYQQFVQHCQAQLLAHFCATYQDAVAPDVLDAFRHHKPWGNQEALAQRYSWGEHERGALQERWGQDLKITSHQHQEATKQVLNKWFDTFEASIWRDAHHDQIVKNPFFYVNKANDLLEQGHYSQAIQYFDRAIALDPQFSITARYNKVRAWLSSEHNKDYHEAALTELRTLKVLIEAYYRKPLTTFNVLTSQTGTKQKLSAHVQHQLDILSQLESYSHQAIATIQDAQKQGKDGWDVKLTKHATTEPFQNTPEDRRQALEEAKINGLTHFFTVEKVQPKPSFWQYFALAIVGIAQAGLGVLLTCAGALNMAKTFITEGVKDLIAAIKKGFKGEGFTWGEWALQKVITITTAIVTWGLNKLKEGIKAVKDGVKQGIEHVKELGTKLAAGGMDGIKKAGIKTAMQRIGLTLGKEVAKEYATEMLNYTADKAMVNDIEKYIQEKVTETIEAELNSNPPCLSGLEICRSKQHKLRGYE